MLGVEGSNGVEGLVVPDGLNAVLAEPALPMLYPGVPW